MIRPGRLRWARPLGVWLLLAVCELTGRCAAGPPACVSVSPASELEQKVVADAADGRLDDFTLIDAALVAGGVVDRVEMQAWSARLRDRSEELAGILADLDRESRPQAVFRFLHGELLRGKYEASCNRLDRTLADGDYNCVSATLLYVQLCRDAGLDAVAVAVPAHVFTRFPSCQLDVETTYPRWFDMAASQRRADAESRRARYQTGTATPREMNDNQLLGKVYFNRGVALLANNEFADAVTCLYLARELDPQDPSAAANLLAALNNWALALGDVGDFEAATQLVTYGLSLDAQSPQLLSNDLHLHQQWALALCQQSRHAEALGLLERGHGRRADAELFDSGRFAVYRRWVESLLVVEKVDEAFSVLSEARRQHPGRAELAGYEAAALQSAAHQLAEHGRWEVAARILERGLLLQPDSQQLRAALRRIKREPA